MPHRSAETTNFLRQTVSFMQRHKSMMPFFGQPTNISTACRMSGTSIKHNTNAITKSFSRYPGILAIAGKCGILSAGCSFLPTQFRHVHWGVKSIFRVSAQWTVVAWNGDKKITTQTRESVWNHLVDMWVIQFVIAPFGNACRFSDSGRSALLAGSHYVVFVMECFAICCCRYHLRCRRNLSGKAFHFGMVFRNYWTDTVLPVFAILANLVIVHIRKESTWSTLLLSRQT